MLTLGQFEAVIECLNSYIKYPSVNLRASSAVPMLNVIAYYNGTEELANDASQVIRSGGAPSTRTFSGVRELPGL